MRRFALRRTFRRLAVAALLLGTHSTVRAQQPSGSTLSPDFQSYMVNKDLGPERWTISLNLFSTDPTSIISITGNIFRADDGPASFVTCLDARGLERRACAIRTSSFRLSCSGAGRVPSTAEACAREAWTLIADDVRVPASFFLPSGGNGTAQARHRRRSTRCWRSRASLEQRSRAGSAVELARRQRARADRRARRDARRSIA